MVQAYILIETAAGHSRRLVESLQSNESVRSVTRVTGPYDVIVVLEAPGIEEISNIVERLVHSEEGVLRTTTCLALG